MPLVNTKLVTATPVLYAHTPLLLTDTCESDVSTAMLRGLAEYLTTLSTQYSGQTHKLAQCYYEWPEPEDTAVFPNALVRLATEVIYDAKTLSGPDINDSAEPDTSNPRKRVAEVSEAIATLQILVRANSPQELRQLVRMIEKALAPVDFIYGVFITLPFYYGQRAAYAKERVKYIYNAEDAQRRIRDAQVFVSVRLMETEVYDAPFTELRLGLTAV